MSKTQNNTDHAWGLELGGSAVRLVRVRRTASGYCVDKYLQVPLANRWSTAPRLAEALAGLGGKATLTGALGAAVPDEWVLFRTMSLPAADDDALGKVVANQIELLLPAQAELFAWSWTRCSQSQAQDGAEVLACAVKKDSLKMLARCEAVLGAAPSAVFPSAVALAAAWPVLYPNDRAVLLVDVAARSTSLVLLSEGKPTRCAVVGAGGDHWSEGIAQAEGISPAQAEGIKLESLSNQGLGKDLSAHVHSRLIEEMSHWAQDLREAWDDCKAGLPQGRLPARCVLVGRAALTEGLQSVAAEALGMEVALAPPPAKLSLQSDVTFDQAAGAIAAAVTALQDRPPAINFAAAPPEPSRAGRKALRWAAVAGWLVAAVIGLYLADHYRAGSLAATLNEARAELGGPRRLATAEAVGQYLEKGAPPPLDVLEEISALMPEQATLTTLRYSRRGGGHSRGGEIMIAGTLPNTAELQTFLQKLQKSPLVSDLVPGPAVVEQNSLKFELTFTAISTLAPRAATSMPTTATSGPSAGGRRGPAGADRSTGRSRRSRRGRSSSDGFGGNSGGDSGGGLGGNSGGDFGGGFDAGAGEAGFQQSRRGPSPTETDSGDEQSGQAASGPANGPASD